MPSRLKLIIPILLLLVILALIAWSTRGVAVIVQNSAALSLDNVKVKFTGGAKPVPRIDPGHSAKVRINPAGESHLELDFDLGHDHRNEVIGTYLEHDYGGSIVLTIDPSGKVAARENIRLVWFIPFAVSL